MALPSRDLTVVVCDSDPWQGRVTAQLLADHGYEVVGVAANAVEAIRLTETSRANAVAITHEHLGMSGLEAIPELRALPHEPEVVLMSIDGTGAEAARAAGAFAVVARGEVESFEATIDDLAHLLRTGERRGHNDRRSGEDRRKAQDWTKVFTERRRGGDRRQGDRRTGG